ncbi:MAG TPA: ElyC/SanA/YdcF family protein, partial [Polyangia bacterium]
LGVPEEKIRQLKPEGGVSHTFDEAKALHEYYRERSFRKVIVVTSDLHSRRASFIFRRIFSSTPVRISLAPVADLKYGAANWWTTEDGVIGCQNEYLKLFYYHLRY